MTMTRWQHCWRVTRESCNPSCWSCMRGWCLWRGLQSALLGSASSAIQSRITNNINNGACTSITASFTTTVNAVTFGMTTNSSWLDAIYYHPINPSFWPINPGIIHQLIYQCDNRCVNPVFAGLGSNFTLKIHRKCGELRVKCMVKNSKG